MIWPKNCFLLAVKYLTVSLVIFFILSYAFYVRETLGVECKLVIKTRAKRTRKDHHIRNVSLFPLPLNELWSNTLLKAALSLRSFAVIRCHSLVVAQCYFLKKSHLDVIGKGPVSRKGKKMKKMNKQVGDCDDAIACGVGDKQVHHPWPARSLNLIALPRQHIPFINKWLAATGPIPSPYTDESKRARGLLSQRRPPVWQLYWSRRGPKTKMLHCKEASGTENSFCFYRQDDDGNG